MTDVYSLRNYAQMVNDTHRTDPFIAALKLAIIPGKSVVLDIGTSFGFFAFLACQLGAAKVYAVESNNSIEIAKLCAGNSPCKDKITWIRGVSTKIDLPEKVDIVIADLHGTLPFYNSNIASIADARKRFLKPGGHLIPMRDRLFVVPAEAFEEYEAAHSPWQSNPHGLDFSAGKVFVINDWWRARPDAVPESNLLSSPQQWGEIDYRTVDSQNIDGRMAWTTSRPGTLHGFYVWFDGEMAENLGYSNAPVLKELVYGRAFFPLEQPLSIGLGDHVSLRMSATVVNNETIYRWDTRVSDSQGMIKADFRQSTFKSRPILAEELQAIAEKSRPALNEDGQIACLVLEAFSDSKSLEQIAIDLIGQFPKRFSDIQAALGHARNLAIKFTG